MSRIWLRFGPYLANMRSFKSPDVTVRRSGRYHILEHIYKLIRIVIFEILKNDKWTYARPYSIFFFLKKWMFVQTDRKTDKGSHAWKRE